LVTVVWQAWLKEGKEAEGIRFAQTHWSELQQFDSYISHRILRATQQAIRQWPVPNAGWPDLRHQPGSVQRQA